MPNANNFRLRRIRPYIGNIHVFAWITVLGPFGRHSHIRSRVLENSDPSDRKTEQGRQGPTGPGWSPKQPPAWRVALDFPLSGKTNGADRHACLRFDPAQSAGFHQNNSRPGYDKSLLSDELSSLFGSTLTKILRQFQAPGPDTRTPHWLWCSGYFPGLIRGK